MMVHFFHFVYKMDKQNVQADNMTHSIFLRHQLHTFYSLKGLICHNVKQEDYLV
jgi:hypothetical protein